jgi:hypothetical protein
MAIQNLSKMLVGLHSPFFKLQPFVASFSIAEAPAEANNAIL